MTAPVSCPTARRPLPVPCLRWGALALWAIAGCGGGEDADETGATAAAAADACGDVDGAGGDTGDVPNVLGTWTVAAGTNVYDDGFCSVPGLEQADLTAWMTGAMRIEGTPPDGLRASFDLSDDDVFYGVEDNRGGLVFTGDKEWAGHRVTVSFGGLMYRQPLVGADEIRGFAYFGVDIDGADTEIDCWLQADFKAYR